MKRLLTCCIVLSLMGTGLLSLMVQKIIQEQRVAPVKPEIWTGPQIPQCNKELWLRIKDGCDD